MRHTNPSNRVAGTWLAVASLLMAAVFAFHGPVAANAELQMQRIADGALRWEIVHWMAAGALSLYAMSGFIVLARGSRLTEGFWTATAWAALPVTALWTVVTAVTETTVIADVAAAGAHETFATWWAYGEGFANGFAFFALAVAVIASGEARASDGAVPPWAAWIGAAAGVGSFAGWGLGMWLGVPAGNLLWFGASLVMSLWLLGFGAALRHGGAGPEANPARD